MQEYTRHVEQVSWLQNTNIHHQGLYISGKAWQIEADKLYNDGKTLQEYTRHVEQVSWLQNTNIHDQGLYISGKAWEIEADKLYNDGKTLHDYTRHVEQQSHGCKTHTQTTFDNCASLLPEQKKLQDVHADVLSLHCDNCDCIWSRLKF